MTKRIKAEQKSLITIKDLEQADDLLRGLGDLQISIEQNEHFAKEQIDHIKATLADSVEPLQAKVTLYIMSLEKFADEHKEEFGKQRSLKLNFGILGWRRSTAIKIKDSTLGFIKQFMPKMAAALIRVKEDVDKEALAKLTDEELNMVDARRKEKDVFYAEPLRPEAVNYGKPST